MSATSLPPPDGFEFLGAKPAPGGRWWRYLCPACCGATVAVIPDGTGWRLASEIGCSRGCEPSAIEWWHAWRRGDLPPPPRRTGASGPTPWRPCAGSSASCPGIPPYRS